MEVRHTIATGRVTRWPKRLPRQLNLLYSPLWFLIKQHKSTGRPTCLKHIFFLFEVRKRQNGQMWNICPFCLFLTSKRCGVERRSRSTSVIEGKRGTMGKCSTFAHGASFSLQ